MSQIIAITLPFFGLIFIGFASARLRALPIDGLAWMNFFIIYIALPALFFNLLSDTPVEKLTSWSFIAGSLLATYCAFAIAFCIGIGATAGHVPQAMVQGLAGAYGNIGYMGPGIAIAALGEAAVVPVALIFCFENIMHFTIAPMMMAISGEGPRQTLLQGIGQVALRILTHPFIIATAVGVTAAVVGYKPPVALEQLLRFLGNAAAPCALFAMGVTIALAKRGAMPPVLGALVPVKLLIHPVLAYVAISWIGDFDPVWVYTAVLLASLPTATNVFVIAQQYDTWVAQASSMVLVSTICSVATVTGLLFLITTGLLPPDLFPAV